MEYILLDIGSSTIKPYYYKNEKLQQLSPKSTHFKNIVIPVEGKKLLIKYINELKTKYPKAKIKTYATSIFRKLETYQKIDLIDTIYKETNVYLNIISQELENFYLEKALLGKFDHKDNVMLLNIGGGSTEIAVVTPWRSKEKHNVDLGVGTIIKKFEGINEKYSKVKKDDIIDFVQKSLPNIKSTCDTAFYTGGELEYMKLTSYNLTPNNLFKDKEHPKIISTDDFYARNKEIFQAVTLKDLKDKMPNNPDWMLGARACSALAEAIFKKYNVQTIIPSNTNLVNGVIQQEYENVTISGSFTKNLDSIKNVKEMLDKREINVLSPKATTIINKKEGFVYLEGDKGNPWKLERQHLNAIDKSDALIVCNTNDYIGASSLMEIGYALKHGIKIVFAETPSDITLKELPAEIGLLA